MKRNELRNVTANATSTAPCAPRDDADIWNRKALPIAVVCACAIGAVVGFWFGRSEGVDQAEAAIAGERLANAAAAEEQAGRFAELALALEKRRRAMRLLEAQRRVHRSLAHLHENNFGLAADAARDAADLLERETSDPRSRELVEELRSVTVEVSPDVRDQALWLAGIASALDELIPTVEESDRL